MKMRWAFLSINQSMTLEDYTTKTRELLLARKFQDALAMSKQAVREHPRQAQFYVFLAECLEQTGQAQYAWPVYERAWMLDPQAAWLPDVRARVEKKTAKKLPDWLSDLLTVPTVRIAAAVIAKNEERTIAACLNALKSAVDQIVVIDTGSTDKTVEIAKKHGAEVHPFTWDDDFSAARNEALKHIQADWVLWVDADEIFDPEDVNVPRIAGGLYQELDPPSVLRIIQVNMIDGKPEPNYDMSRFFPMRFGLRWWGRIHEQIGPPSGGLFSELYARPVVRIRVNHDGYDPTIMQAKGKLERNITLLKKSVEDDPNDIGSLGFLGREYYLTQQYEEAVRVLYRAEAIAMTNPKYGRLPEVRAYLVEALMRLNRHQEAIVASERAIQADPNFPTAWFGLGKARLGYGLSLIRDAFQDFANSRDRAPMYRGIVSYDSQIATWKALASLADVAKVQGDWVRARQFYLQALEQSPGNPAILGQIQFIDAQAAAIVAQSQAQPLGNPGTNH